MLDWLRELFSISFGLGPMWFAEGDAGGEAGDAGGEKEAEKEAGAAEGAEAGQKEPGAEESKEAVATFDFRGQRIEVNEDQRAYLLRTGMAALADRRDAADKDQGGDGQEAAEQEKQEQAGAASNIEQRLAKAEQEIKASNARSEKLETQRSQDLMTNQVQRALDKQAAKHEFTRDDEDAQAEIHDRVLLAIRRDGNKSVDTAYKEEVAKMETFIEKKAGKSKKDWTEKKIKDGKVRGQLGGGAARGGEVRTIKGSDLEDGTADKEALEMLDKLENA